MYYSTTNSIPKMTSDNTPNGIARCSTIGGTNRAYMAFDRNGLTRWESSSSALPQWLSYEFPSPKVIYKYTITSYFSGWSPKTWQFQGSNDNSTWTTLDTRTFTFTSNYQKAEFVIPTNKVGLYKFYRVYITDAVSGGSVIAELEMFEVVYSVALIVKAHEEYFTFSNGVWTSLGKNELDDTTFINSGITPTILSGIPQSSWEQFKGEATLLCFTDNPYTTELKLSFNTESFSLIQELDGKQIKVIEYTDTPSQTISTVTLETSETFDFYDEFGDQVDVLYYTDSTLSSNPKVEINANYSPLDELNEDFELVSYSSKDDISLVASLNGLPKGQMVMPSNNVLYFGDIQSLNATKITNTLPLGKALIVVSFDGGETWKSYRLNKWETVDVTSKTSVRRYAMNIDELNAIPTAELQNNITDDGLRLAYYVEESITENQEAKIGFVKLLSKANVNDVKFNNLAFYMLNTTATINLLFAGNKIQGTLDDADNGKVKYRVLLNGEPYYPATGKFTELAPSPQKINIVVDDRKIKFGVNNTLKVEFQDYWGIVDSWTSTFIGTHSGLVFTDESGNFYTTAFGEVLKNLDFGQIIAGQTTLDYKILLKNNIGYEVKNVKLQAIQPNLDGVTVELSKEQAPFIPVPEIVYQDVLKAGDSVEFAVRVSTLLTAQETPSGRFEIRVNADRVY